MVEHRFPGFCQVAALDPTFLLGLGSYLMGGQLLIQRIQGCTKSSGELRGNLGHPSLIDNLPEEAQCGGLIFLLFELRLIRDMDRFNDEDGGDWITRANKPEGI